MPVFLSNGAEELPSSRCGLLRMLKNESWGNKNMVAVQTKHVMAGLHKRRNGGLKSMRQRKRERET